MEHFTVHIEPVNNQKPGLRIEPAQFEVDEGGFAELNKLSIVAQDDDTQTQGDFGAWLFENRIHKNNVAALLDHFVIVSLIKIWKSVWLSNLKMELWRILAQLLEENNPEWG